MNSMKSLSARILKRHPELQKLEAKQLRSVKKAIEEALTWSTIEVLSAEDTDREFRRLIPNSGTSASALRAYRLRAELTQRQLAQKSGVPQPHIAQMESGKRPIGLITAKRLALALGLHYRKLV